MGQFEIMKIHHVFPIWWQDIPIKRTKSNILHMQSRSSTLDPSHKDLTGEEASTAAASSFQCSWRFEVLQLIHTKLVAFSQFLGLNAYHLTIANGPTHCFEPGSHKSREG
jgi:hypothetical protein